MEEQNKTLSKTFVTYWDNVSQSTKVIEGKISEVAQTNLNKNNEQIALYNSEIEELQKQKLDIIEKGGISEQTSNISTFSALIKKYIGIDTKYLAVFLLLFCSVFIDIISPMALCIVRFKVK